MLMYDGINLHIYNMHVKTISGSQLFALKIDLALGACTFMQIKAL